MKITLYTDFCHRHIRIRFISQTNDKRCVHFMHLALVRAEGGQASQNETTNKNMLNQTHKSVCKKREDITFFLNIS